jgi:hypothetical protein
VISSGDAARPSVTVALSGTVSASGPAANFAGQWNLTTNGTSTYALTLAQTGFSVTGTYAGSAGALSGTVSGNVLTGTWTEQVGRGNFAFTLSAGGNSFTGTWSCTSGCTGSGNWNGARVPASGVLFVDDGTFEEVIGFTQGGFTAYFANRLTPTRYPATLRAVQIRFPANELPAGTTFTVMAAAHPSGASGSPLTNVNWQTVSAQITAPGQFVEYPIPPVTITSGDFLVGYSVVNPADVFPASLDSTPPARGRSYLGTSAASIRFPSAGNEGNLGIRARVEDGSPGGNAACANLAGDWRSTITGVGSSTWTLTPNAAGGYRAVESGLGAATGTATFQSSRLRIDFTWSGGAGYYDWTLDSTCTQGSGNLVYTAGLAGTLPSTVVKIR